MLKAADPDSQQPYAQVLSRKSVVENSHGCSRDLLRGVAGFRKRFRASDGLEISKPDLELDGSASETLAAQPSRHLVGEFEEPRLEDLWILDVFGKRGFGRDRLCLVVGHDLPVIHAMGQSPEVLARLTEVIDEDAGGQIAKLPNRADAQLPKNLTGDASYAPESGDGQRIEKLLHLTGIDDDKTVWLLQITGNLGHELHRSHAHRRLQTKLLADLCFEQSFIPWGAVMERVGRRSGRRRLV